MSSPGSYPTPASEEIQEIFLIPNMQRIFFLSPRLLLLFIFIFYKTGEKSELGWGQGTRFSTKVQNCL